VRGVIGMGGCDYYGSSLTHLNEEVECSHLKDMAFSR
jgi:hypothetical protein